MALLIGTDTGLSLTNVKDSRTGDFVSAATVTGKVLTTAEVQVGSDINCPAVDGEPGSYYGVVPDTLAITQGTQYIVEVEIDDVASGKQTTIRRTEVARYVE